jgi:hypothetical protein
MSETVINGSIEVWRQLTREMEQNQGNGEAEGLIDTEIEQQGRNADRF